MIRINRESGFDWIIWLGYSNPLQPYFFDYEICQFRRDPVSVCHWWSICSLLPAACQFLIYLSPNPGCQVHKGLQLFESLFSGWATVWNFSPLNPFIFNFCVFLFWGMWRCYNHPHSSHEDTESNEWNMSHSCKLWHRHPKPRAVWLETLELQRLHTLNPTKWLSWRFVRSD